MSTTTEAIKHWEAKAYGVYFDNEAVGMLQRSEANKVADAANAIIDDRNALATDLAAMRAENEGLRDAAKEARSHLIGAKMNFGKDNFTAVALIDAAGKKLIVDD